MMFGSREEFPYYECAGCGCLWIAKMPTDLSRHYGSGYYSFKGSAFGMWVRRHPPLYRVAHYARFHSPPRLPEWWPTAVSPERASVLDVGCGVGHLLLRLKCLGYRNLLGIDPFVQEDIRIPNGPTILKRSIAEVSGQFDVVIMNHSLEHMSDPESVFRELKRLLTPLGSAVIRTPVASGQAWRKYASDWVQLDAPRHLVVHTFNSIRVLAKANGLRLNEVIYDSTAFQFWGSEQYRRGIPLSDPRSYQRSARRSLFTRREIDEFSRQASELNKRGEGDQACFYLRHL
jgi:SAM-dependent methyltransferase